MLEVILDTETTGLSTAENHRIVEIGCLELNNQIATNRVFHQHINPGRSVSKEAYKVHGYSEKFLSDKKTFSEISEDFLNFIKDKKIVVFHEPDLIKDYIKEHKDIDLILHGHTHRYKEEKIDKTVYFNPGESAGSMEGKSALGVVNLNNLEIRRIFF